MNLTAREYPECAKAPRRWGIVKSAIQLPPPALSCHAEFGVFAAGDLRAKGGLTVQKFLAALTARPDAASPVAEYVVGPPSWLL